MSIFLLPSLEEEYIQSFEEMKTGNEMNVNLKALYEDLTNQISKMTTFSMSLPATLPAEKLNVLDKKKKETQEIVKTLEEKELQLNHLLDENKDELEKRTKLKSFLLELLETAQNCLNWEAKLEGQTVDELTQSLAEIESHVKDYRDQLDKIKEQGQSVKLKELHDLKSQIHRDRIRVTKETTFFEGFRIFVKQLEELELSVDSYLEKYFGYHLRQLEVNLEKLMKDINEKIDHSNFTGELQVTPLEVQERIAKWRDNALVWLEDINQTTNFVGKLDLIQRAFHISEIITEFSEDLDAKLFSAKVKTGIYSLGSIFGLVEERTQLRDTELKEIQSSN